MEFVETLSFWCPHVGCVVCTNFSTRTVELRPSERQELLHFLSLLSFPSFSFFPFLFFPSLSTNSSPLRIVFLFLSFLSFLIIFSFPISHLIFLLAFLLLFGALLTVWVKGGNFLPIFSSLMCGHQISFFYSLFLISFMTSHSYMAHCEPSF